MVLLNNLERKKAEGAIDRVREKKIIKYGIITKDREP